LTLFAAVHKNLLWPLTPVEKKSTGPTTKILVANHSASTDHLLPLPQKSLNCLSMGPVPDSTRKPYTAWPVLPTPCLKPVILPPTARWHYDAAEVCNLWNHSTCAATTQKS